MNHDPILKQEHNPLSPQEPHPSRSVKWIAWGCGLLVLLIVALVVWAVVLPNVQKERYALDYPEIIAQYAGEYDLDPYLVAAIIHVESKGNPDAESSVGAVGLMQVMPSTGEWIAEKLKRPFDVSQLKDPATNIEMGCWYLNFLNQRFASQDTAIAAYNAGHGRVGEWLGDEQYSQNQEDLLEIPYPETEHYVQKVREAYEKYKEFYPEVFA